MGINPVFDRSPAAEDRIEQRLPIQAELQSLPHLHVIERSNGFVERDVGYCDPLDLVEPVLVDIPMEEELGVVADVAQIEDVELAVLEQHSRFFRLGDESHVQPVTKGRSVPAIPVCRERHALFRLPCLQDERTGPDRAFRIHPETVADDNHGLFVHNGSTRHGHARQERLEWPL